MDSKTSTPILHVVQHLSPGGLEVLALELARFQNRDPITPTAVMSLEGHREKAETAWPKLKEFGHAVYKEDMPSLAFMEKIPGIDFNLVTRLVSFIKSNEIFCVHTHHVGPLLYAGIAARIAGVGKVIHTEHDAWHLSDPKRRKIVKLALAIARPIVVADAPHVADAFSSQMGMKRPRVILNGVDTSRFRKLDRKFARLQLSLPEDAPIIGVAARLETVKGVDIAIDAFSKLPSSTVLAIAGHGSQRESLEAQAKSLGVFDRVKFIGLVDDMPLFHSAINVLCVPSRNEGLPLAPLEAQSCGTPVVAAKVGGVPSAVCPTTGILVKPESAYALSDGLACALHGITGDPREFVVKNASLETAATAYSKILTE